ncbi:MULTISPECIES: hypothetical protein [unclassified Streptomyces]|uniref:hypothetical protein n=1 Tax=unclassified Streptomyces TaxID=2593676 RepID=UPI00081D6BC7|nr:MULTISPECIES: hypothetical protein [unclassified Streptomyces]MYZ35475.1 hypothetical protein [Streptomyces sp. SID4917]SCF75768.1 acrosin [Streptomyces sp. MnatMP-M17]
MADSTQDDSIIIGDPNAPEPPSEPPTPPQPDPIIIGDPGGGWDGTGDPPNPAPEPPEPDPNAPPVETP